MNLHVDITLAQGSFTLETAFHCAESALGIFGPSGCGKSTLFRAIAGLSTPQRGQISFGGHTLFDSERHLNLPPHKRGIGLVFQDARLMPHWSVKRNLLAGEKIRARVDGRPFGFDDVVDLLDIRPLIGGAISGLSGGEQQRVAIGRTLLSNPRLLLMDEPVSGLDVSLKSQILPFLTDVHRAFQIPTLLISHDLSEILQLTSQILLLREGRVVAINRLEQLVQRPQSLAALRGSDLTNILKGRLIAHQLADGTSRLELCDGDAPVSIVTRLMSQHPLGRELTLGINANQIALSLDPVQGLSIRNQIPATITQIIHADARSLCVVQCAAGSLFAEITPGTERALALTQGKRVWLLFKSLAVRHLGTS